MAAELLRSDSRQNARRPSPQHASCMGKTAFFRFSGRSGGTHRDLRIAFKLFGIRDELDDFYAIERPGMDRLRVAA
jgi:hypothetical protein